MSMTTLDEIEEGNTAIYTAILQDETGLTLTSLPFTAARLTLVSAQSGAIINSREGQNILNNALVPEVTISGAGTLTWKLLEPDVIIVDEPKPERAVHRATFVLEWLDANGIARQLTHAIEVPLRRSPNSPFSA
jgi:hypothetical protein